MIVSMHRVAEAEIVAEAVIAETSGNVIRRDEAPTIDLVVLVERHGDRVDQLCGALRRLAARTVESTRGVGRL